MLGVDWSVPNAEAAPSSEVPDLAALGVLTLYEPVVSIVLGTRGCKNWQRLFLQLDCCCGCCWPRAQEVFLDNLELLAGSSQKIL